MILMVSASLSIVVELYLAWRPITWIYAGKTKGKIKTLAPWIYIFNVVLASILFIPIYTYNRYKGISKEQEDAVVSLITTIKKTPIIFTGFFQPHNSFIDTTWIRTRKADNFYQGQAQLKDLFGIHSMFDPDGNKFSFFSPNYQNTTIYVVSVDSVMENGKMVHLVTARYAGDTNYISPPIRWKYSTCKLFFTREFIQRFELFDKVDLYKLPVDIRKIVEEIHFPEGEQDIQSFRKVSEQKTDFVLFSHRVDSTFVGDTNQLIYSRPMISFRATDNLYKFLVITDRLYNECAYFLKVRGLKIDLSKPIFTEKDFKAN